MWKEGSLKVYNSIFHYWLKVYDECSQYGIDGGKVSKLMPRIFLPFTRKRSSCACISASSTV